MSELRRVLQFSLSVRQIVVFDSRRAVEARAGDRRIAMRRGAQPALALAAVILVLRAAPADGCSCQATPGAALSLTKAASSSCADFAFSSESGHITVHSSDGSHLCLGYADGGRVIALPCNDVDEGQQWAFSPFHENAVVNHATMQCMSAAGGGGVRLAECAASADQRWKLSTAPAGAPLLSLLGSGSANQCVAMSELVDGPCWVNTTLTFSGSGGAPMGAALGMLPASFSGELSLSAEVNVQVDTAWARIFDFGTDVVPNGKVTGNNIILSCSHYCVYQVYHDTQSPTPALIQSKDPVPHNQWIRVAVVHQAGVASMYFNAGAKWELQATGNVDPPAAVPRTRNWLGVSNWAADPLFKGSIRSPLVWDRALSMDELEEVSATSKPLSGLPAMCASAPAPPPPSPPEEISLALDLTKAVGVVEPELYGHDLEFTRHDLFTGLSAELVANRKFAVPTPCDGSGMACWPQPVQALMAANFTPRWDRCASLALSPLPPIFSHKSEKSLCGAESARRFSTPLTGRPTLRWSPATWVTRFAALVEKGVAESRKEVILKALTLP
eukprot:COSAG03_NODE_426_length_8006_cov_75.576957_7_plen_558_part_00